MAFLKIDKALGEYYAALGQNDYYDSDNKGKFFRYCKENGFDEDDIDEEFGTSPEDCMYPDFDEDFPLKPPVTDSAAKQAEIFNIIKYCYDNNKPPTAKANTQKRKSVSKNDKNDQKMMAPKDIMDIVIQTDKKTQKQCNKLYREQCPLLYNEEDVLKRCFAISLKNNRYPFLVNLVDSFLRDKALYQREFDDDLQTVKWRNKSRYFKKLNKEQKEMSDTLASGVETYLRRGCTSWDYGPAKLARIQDSMRDVMQYVLMGYNLIQNLIKTEGGTPFQIDMPIAVHRVKKLKFIVNDEDLSCSDDSDGGSDDDIDDRKYKDYVGDVEQKLNGNKLVNYAFEMKTDLSATSMVTRTIKTAFDQYKNKISKKYGKNESYPNRKRFCIFIDRRKGEKSKCDKIILFEPPQNCSSMPQNMMPEWYFNASKTCIIPGRADPNNGKPSHTETIRANSEVDGQILTVSFQCEESDILKVYLFWMGRYTRVYAEDLETILPQIFEMGCCGNKLWNKDKTQEFYSILKQLQFTDADFESFYHQVSYKAKHNEFPKRYS